MSDQRGARHLADSESWLAYQREHAAEARERSEKKRPTPVYVHFGVILATAKLSEIMRVR